MASKGKLINVWKFINGQTKYVHKLLNYKIRKFYLFSDAWKYPISASKESIEKAKAIREMALRKRKSENDGQF